MNKIDLAELATRESERVEWKENVADFSDVVKTAVAFANDFSSLGGGYIVCGAKEEKDEYGFQKVIYIGLTSSKLKEVEGKVLNNCQKNVDPPIIPLTEEINTADSSRRILVFIVPASRKAHLYKKDETESGKYYIRIGRDTKEARNGNLRELLTLKSELETWDKRVNEKSNLSDIDLIIFRDYMQEMGLWDPKKSIEDYFSSEYSISAFVPPFAKPEKLSKEIRLKNFVLLLFSKNPLSFFLGAYCVFSIYNGKDRSESFSEKKEITGTVIQQAKKIIELLNTEAYSVIDKTDPSPNMEKYPQQVLKEAIVNALAHRDYESSQPIRITIFSDRIEILSPGSLPRAIDQEKFKKGESAPFWRNQTLAYFFNKLQLAQSEGQGIPSILRLMKECGCPEPKFEIGLESVTCILPAHPRHELLKELKNIENKIIIGNLFEPLVSLEKMIRNDPYHFRCWELYCEANNLNSSKEKIYDLFEELNVDFKKIPSSSLVIISETLSRIEGNKEVNRLASEMLTYATSGRLEESEIKKIAISFRKLGRNEKAVEFINKIMSTSPKYDKNATLLELKAKSQIDLAKQCMETARNKQTSKNMKGKSWDQCREYLAKAKQDLNKALENVTNPFEREYIVKDFDFLKHMEEIASPPNNNSQKRTPFKKKLKSDGV
jgi:predicted HTH transcriptional regulator